MTYVIVGAGLAGAEAAATLREQGYRGPVILLGAESHPPYERPPLSKEYLHGGPLDAVFVHSPEWYRHHDVELRLEATVDRIDRANAQAVLVDGERINYTKLLLTTGSSPRELAVPGAADRGVMTLRTLEDSQRLRDALRPGTRIAVVGAGWLGLEVAAAARGAGAAVTVLEVGHHPLPALRSPRIGAVFTDLHRKHGAELHCDAQVVEIIAAHRRVRGLRLDDGRLIETDLVVVAIGAVPQLRLALRAGLEVSDGVLVDAQLRTSDPRIHAAGDIASIPYPALGRHLRVQHQATARYSGRVAAHAMLDPHDPAGTYDRLPFVFSDQYDLGLEFTGALGRGPHHLVVRGDLGAHEFVAFWLRDRRLCAAMNVNVWNVAEEFDRLIRSDRVLDPSRLADPSMPLRAL